MNNNGHATVLTDPVRDALIFMLGGVVLGFDPQQLGGAKKQMLQDAITHACEALGIDRGRSDWVEKVRRELIMLRDRHQGRHDTFGGIALP